MFAYCRNNPVCRRDIPGTTDEECYEPNGNLLTEDDKSIEGGKLGNTGSNSTPTSVDDFLASHGQNPQDVLDCFSGEPQLQVLTEDTTVYRVWGGTTSESGHWVSPNNYGDAARSQLSLPPGNTMAYTSAFVIPCGTTVLTGVASPNFKQLGGGIQWWVVRVAF